MTPKRLAAALFTVALLASAAVAASPATATPLDLPVPPMPDSARAPAPPPPERLVRLLDDLRRFRQTRPGGPIGVAAVTGTGATLTGANADRSLLPASTMKLLTAAAALRVLGPRHRFVTRVYATTAPTADGVVDGDLIIVGGGDPVLATPLYTARVNAMRPATPLARLARRVASGGVSRVRGRVLGDPSVLVTQPTARGWLPEYLTSLNARRSAGLTVDAGLRLVRRSGRLIAVAAENPARQTAARFDDLLHRRRVRTAGRPGTRASLPDGAVEVARIASPPLEVLLAHMMRYSDNHLADGVFRMVGAASGDATWRGSAHATRAALADLDVRWRDLRLADGSGLSRRDRLTANALVELLRAMAEGPERGRWLGLLPVAGRSGTLAGRLTGTIAEGRVHAKTGTLRDARALAGTVPGRRGAADHHFAVLANGLAGTGPVAARRLADVLALALVADQDGCRGRVIPPERTGRRRTPEWRICPLQRDSRR